MTKLLKTDASGLDSLDADAIKFTDAAHLRRIIQAREGIQAAEQELRDAVKAARAAGDSWVTIAVGLGTTKQAAQQRFGKYV